MYQKEETLWKMNSPWYRNKAARQEACERILVRVQEHMPKATVDTIVRKLKHLRTSFCKQKKMINDSIKAGATGDKVYKPKAWWYYALLFVNNQEDDNVTVPRSQHSENSNTKVGANFQRCFFCFCLGLHGFISKCISTEECSFGYTVLKNLERAATLECFHEFFCLFIHQDAL